jgi:DNA modification methylase
MSQIIKRQIKELKSHPSNPRKISEYSLETLKKSLEKDPGFFETRPIIVNKRSGYVIAGNQRLRAATELGWKEVPVIEVDLDDETEKRWALKDNKPLGEWDWELLKAYDMELLREVGFLQEEIAKALAHQEVQDDEFDLEEALAAITVPHSKTGDVYILGKHRMLCGDATNPADYKKLMDGEKAQMVFTDPPYNIDYQGNGVQRREGIMNDSMGQAEFQSFLDKAMSALMPHVSGAMYVCMSPKELTTLKRAFEGSGGHFQSFLIWVKNSFTLGGADWQNQYEPILYGWPEGVVDHYFVGYRNEGNIWKDLDKHGVEFNDGKTLIKLGEYHLEIDGEVTGKIMSKKGFTDLWPEKKPAKSKLHPTMKPLKLIAKAINASSFVESVVLDPFGGSGSTLVACEELNRKCYMMELDPKYVDVIVERWERLTGEKATKL